MRWRGRLWDALSGSAGATAILIGMLANVLASEANSDALLIVADALEETAPHQVWEAQRANLRALAQVFRDEAPNRAGDPAWPV